MFVQIVKAFLVGICASVPLGPAAILVLQKTLSYGRSAGFATGLGVTTVDTAYATLAVFALAIVQDFLGKYQTLVYLIGGLIVVAVGFSMAFKDPFRKMKSESGERGPSPRDYIQAVGIGLSNPGAVFVMLALFTFFGLDVSAGGAEVFAVIMGVAAGSASYWYGFTLLFGKWRKYIDLKAILWLNRIAGLIIMIIGISLFGSGAFDLVFGKEV